ncbi:MAG: 30S ribosomal protein S18 [bacterium]|nr:30S ribosomal protein S18 [bacterium]
MSEEQTKTTETRPAASPTSRPSGGYAGSRPSSPSSPSSPRPGGGRPGGARPTGGRKFYARRKFCKFCGDEKHKIDYKDSDALRQFITERGKIMPRRISGVCAPHQRKLSSAIKRARNLALLPLCAEHH